MKRLHAKLSGACTMEELCGLFGKSKQAYYKHDEEAALRRAASVEFAMQFILEVRERDPGIGGLKIWVMYRALFAGAWPIGRDRFCDIFESMGMKAVRHKRGVRTTDSAHGNPLYPNLVKALVPLRLGELIVSDITYIALAGGGERRFCYVSLVMDSYSKVLLGFSAGPTLSSAYAIEALEMAIAALEALGADLSRAIHHSDRGVQYTCSDYIRMLKERQIKISMTESGNPKDNAEAERLNNTLKNELFKGMEFRDTGQVREALRIAAQFYNYERPHRSLEMMTPMEAARRTGRFKRLWTSYREKAIDENENKGMGCAQT